VAHSQKKTENASFSSSGDVMMTEYRDTKRREEKKIVLNGHVTRGTLLGNVAGKRTWPQIFTFGIIEDSSSRGSINPLSLFLSLSRTSFEATRKEVTK
jgi:hypothetical protein